LRAIHLPDKYARGTIRVSFGKYNTIEDTTPSAEKIAQGVGISRTTAYRYLVEMDNHRMIEYDGKSRNIHTPIINKFALDSAPRPLWGSIPCGSAQTEEENLRKYISLPVFLFEVHLFVGQYDSGMLYYAKRNSKQAIYAGV
jgi:repressor LexA